MKNKIFRKWAPLFALSLSLAIIIIDGTVLNVSLSNIIKDLNTDLKQMQTVITTYSLIMASFMITGGILGDIFGRKKMFILGAIVFGIGSLIASISTNVTTLLIGWSIIEGIGAALMMPATASLILSSYQGKDRALAFGIWGGIAGAAAAFGPLFGGYITTNYSWHWAFLINIFVIIVLSLAESA
jgi:MFS family permease